MLFVVFEVDSHDTQAKCVIGQTEASRWIRLKRDIELVEAMGNCFRSNSAINCGAACDRDVIECFMFQFDTKTRRCCLVSPSDDISVNSSKSGCDVWMKEPV